MSLTTEVKKVESEFDKVIEEIKSLFEGHPNVDLAVSHINEAKDAATIPTPEEVTPAANNAAS
jgi:hypothetical protein